MGGVIGATSGKFVLIAATLLFHGRIEKTRSTIALMPGTPRSAISGTVAKRLKQSEPVTIGIGAEYLRASIASVEVDPAQGADVRIGRDILDANPVEIDFPHHQLRLLLASEARRAERGMIAIPVTHRADGTMTVPLTFDDTAPTAAILDLAQPGGVTIPTTGARTITIGPVALSTAAVSAGAAPSVGLGAFTTKRVIFDLGHDQIWVAT